MKPDENNIDELLVDYALGELDADETARVELLLAERPELMREARALKRTVSRMGVSMIMPPPQLVSRTRHAAYAARSKRRGILHAALRRPVTVAAAGLVAAALVLALIGPGLWSGTDDQPTAIGQAATISEELRTFLEHNLAEMRALSRGEAPAEEDFSRPAAQAMLFLEEQPLAPPQRAVLEDVEAVWRYGYERVSSQGRLTDETLAELKKLVTRKRLVERTEAMLAEQTDER
jgi:hypothetical protein